jgi:hypothetical protein
LLLYALNPLVIIELTGNLHSEVWCLPFLSAFLLFFLKNRLNMSALFLALAISVKLWPLLFVVLVWKWLRPAERLRFYGLTMLLTFILLIPIWNSALPSQWASGLQLYFNRFEFNAALYYLWRWLMQPANQQIFLQVSMLIFSIISALAILVLTALSPARHKTDLIKLFLFSYLIYLVFSATVHPWYVLPLVLFSVFVRSRFAMAWSFAVAFTYITYRTIPYQELIWLVWLEYAVVIIVLFLEWRSGRLRFIQTDHLSAA